MTGSERAALDAEYNLRAAVPEHADHFAWYDQASEALRSARAATSLLDLAYGHSLRARIDLHRPDGEGPHPALVFIHGGYWQSQDRKRYAFLAEPFLASGIAVALLGYDLAPEVDLDTIVDQARRGFAWLWRQAPGLGLHPERIAIAGHSAGGHLIATLLATDWTAEGLPAAPIVAACPISGIFDLEPIRGCYLNDVLALTPDQMRRLSPLHLPVRVSCPVLVTVGGAETLAFLQQSAAFARRLERTRQPVSQHVAPGQDHFTILKDMVRRDARPVLWIREQLGQTG